MKKILLLLAVALVMLPVAAQASLNLRLPVCRER